MRVAGVRHRRKSPKQSRHDAVAFEAQVLQELRRRAVRAGKMGLGNGFETVAEFAPEWIELDAVPRNKPSAVLRKRENLRRDIVPFFGAMRLQDITAETIARFIAVKRGKGLATNTVNNMLGTLSGMLRCAAQWGLIDRAPKIPFFRTHYGAVRFLEPFESARLLAAAPSPMWRSMVMLALKTGMRVGELKALTWENVDLPRRMVHVRQSLVNGVLGTPKTHHSRVVPLSNDALSALLEVGPATGWVFKQWDGRALTSGVTQRALHKMCDTAGLERFGWHVLRHTFATQLSELNAPIRTIQEMLGHATLRMTMRYSHVTPRGLQASAELLDGLEERAKRIVPSVGHQSGHSHGEPVMDDDIRIARLPHD